MTQPVLPQQLQKALLVNGSMHAITSSLETLITVRRQFMSHDIFSPAHPVLEEQNRAIENHSNKSLRTSVCADPLVEFLFKARKTLIEAHTEYMKTYFRALFPRLPETMFQALFEWLDVAI